MKIEPTWVGETYGRFKDEQGSDPCGGCIYNIYENVLACVACVLKDKQSGKE